MVSPDLIEFPDGHPQMGECGIAMGGDHAEGGGERRTSEPMMNLNRNGWY